MGVVLYEMMVGIPPFYNDNMKVLYENIEKGKLTLPRYLSKEARNVVKRMLNKDPKKRPTLDELLKDPFFADIDWEKLARKELEPPQILLQDKSSSKKDKNDNQEMLFESDSDQDQFEQRGGPNPEKK